MTEDDKMNYRDFFDDREKDMPFATGLESTCAYLRWFDMFLQAAVEKRQGGEDALTGMDLRRAAAILGSRVEVTQGKEITGLDGLSIVNVAAGFGLYDYSFFCLIMAIAQEFDGRYIKRYRAALDDEEISSPNFALEEKLYSQIADDENLMDMGRIRSIIDHCPLFNITMSKKGQGGLMDSFEANRQLVALLKGDYLLIRELSRICNEVMGVSKEEVLVHKDQVKELRTYLDSLDAAEASFGEGKKGMDGDISFGTVIHITGGKSSGRLDIIRGAIGEKGSALIMDLSLLSLLDSEQFRDTVSDALVRVRLLQEELVIIADQEKDPAALGLIIRSSLEQLGRMFVLTSDDFKEVSQVLSASEDENYFRIKLSLPTAAEQQRLWERELSKIKTAKDVKASDFAGVYRLSPQVITDCVSQAWATVTAKGKKSVSREDIVDSVLANTTGNLDALSNRMPLSFTWDDLIIDPRQKKIMETLVSRVRNRSLVDETWGFNEKVPYGRGVSLILYGPPGTGKTMAAQVMAKEIGMALYRVDLSQMVDKYVGETEKNIGKIFDAASDGNVILFFDEADALFSKRTEVSTSNDKHANTEVAYLLQKIEQHDGITFLATNRFKDFDNAFVRRITYAVHLERPDEDRRLELFEKILPDRTPRDKNLDLEFFAKNFDLSGSEIKEVLYSAAFIAAMEGKSLNNKHLSEAIRYQQEKIGKVLQGADFGGYL